jgi:hypothetical protein
MQYDMLLLPVHPFLAGPGQAAAPRAVLQIQRLPNRLQHTSNRRLAAAETSPEPEGHAGW